MLTKKTKQFVFLHGLTSKVTTYDSFKTGSKMFFLGQIGLGWVQRSSKVALKKKGALFGHSSRQRSNSPTPGAAPAKGGPRGGLPGWGSCSSPPHSTWSGTFTSSPPGARLEEAWVDTGAESPCRVRSHSSTAAFCFLLSGVSGVAVFVFRLRRLFFPVMGGLELEASGKFLVFRLNTEFSH